MYLCVIAPKRVTSSNIGSGPVVLLIWALHFRWTSSQLGYFFFDNDDDGDDENDDGGNDGDDGDGGDCDKAWQSLCFTFEWLCTSVVSDACACASLYTELDRVERFIVIVIIINTIVDIIIIIVTIIIILS